MYAYIFGKVRGIKSDCIILDHDNIGYKILTPNPYVFISEENVRVYLHLHIREDAHELYGFRTEAEKDLFEKLISVSGIGPKSACAILAAGDVASVTKAINEGDANYLTRFPKVGQKTAQQIILDLKGKLTRDGLVFNKELDDAVEALRALGYKEKEIESVVKAIGEEKHSTQEYITKALALLLGGKK